MSDENTVVEEADESDLRANTHLAVDYMFDMGSIFKGEEPFVLMTGFYGDEKSRLMESDELRGQVENAIDEALLGVFPERAAVAA